MRGVEALMTLHITEPTKLEEMDTLKASRRNHVACKSVGLGGYS